MNMVLYASQKEKLTYRRTSFKQIPQDKRTITENWRNGSTFKRLKEKSAVLYPSKIITVKDNCYKFTTVAGTKYAPNFGHFQTEKNK